MNREALKALGLTDEQIEEVMKSHGGVVNATKLELDTVTTDRDELKTQLTDRDTQLVDLKKIDHEGLQSKITELETANETTAAEYQKKLTDQAFNFALEKELTTAKAKNAKSVIANLDTELLKLENGELKGLKEQLEVLQKSDSYLFDVEDEQEEGKPKFTTGNHNKDNKTTSKDLSKMSYKERVKFKTDNPTAYADLTGK